MKLCKNCTVRIETFPSMQSNQHSIYKNGKAVGIFGVPLAVKC